MPGFASYKPDRDSGIWTPWSITLLETDAGEGALEVVGVRNFLAPFLPDLFSSFDLPEQLDGNAPTVNLSDGPASR